MAESIITFVIIFCCGSVFYGIGMYASKIEKPMGFWSGIEVKASEITDIKQYNKENSIMWKVYGLWYYLAAFMGFFYPIFAFILMILSCTLGLVLLIMNYRRIEKKYKRKDEV